jgi:signal transduction histidine kinase
MLAEAQRASEVVRRLRDLFRQGTTRLEPVPVIHLLEAARRAAPGSLRVSSEGELPDVLVDRLQIELVLRNLVANAVDAVLPHAAGSREIAVTARRHDARHLRIVVVDNGPGISPAAAKTLFEPFVSGKPSGMGLGLAVSRAIAEAHGGTLEARAASHGEFHLVLPFSSHA